MGWGKRKRKKDNGVVVNSRLPKSVVRQRNMINWYRLLTLEEILDTTGYYHTALTLIIMAIVKIVIDLLFCYGEKGVSIQENQLEWL